MEISAGIIAEIWETIKDYIASNKREEVITGILETLVDNEVEIDDVEELRDIDDDLDSAIASVFGDEEVEEDYDE